MDGQKKQDEQERPFVGAVSVGDIRTEKYSVNEKKR